MASDVLLSAIAQGLLWSIMAIGIYISYRILDMPDLTAEGCFTLGASIAGALVTKNLVGGLEFLSDPLIASFVAFLGGVLAGLVTAILHTKLKIPGLLSGILTMTALYSINLKIMGKSLITLSDSNLESISFLKPLESIEISPDNFFYNMSSIVKDSHITKNFAAIVYGLVIVLIVVVILCWFFNTEIGYMVRATGANPNMVRALGTNTDFTIIIGLCIGNGLIAFSSSLVSQFNGYVDISMGVGTIVIGLSSVIIGEVVFESFFMFLFKKKTIFFSLISVVLGSILYRLVIAYILKLGLNTNDLKLFTSIILAIALSSPLIGNKLKKKVRS